MRDCEDRRARGQRVGVQDVVCVEDGRGVEDVHVARGQGDGGGGVLVRGDLRGGVGDVVGGCADRFVDRCVVISIRTLKVKADPVIWRGVDDVCPGNRDNRQ